MPGRPWSPPSRAAGGRGARWSPGWPSGAGARSAGAGRRPMPWLVEKGLLPGRGAPGRPTGRGAGALAAGASGAAGAWAAAAAAGASATGAASTGAGSTGASTASDLAAGRGPGRTADLVGAGAASAAGAAAADSAGAGSAAGAFAALAAGTGALAASLAVAGVPAALSSSPYCFLKRIATGGSTVEDADFTNSPISFSFSRTNLLSTPNSLASSWTRGLATLLRNSFWPEPRLSGRKTRWFRTVSGCACSSGSTHRVLMSCCSSFWSVDHGQVLSESMWCRTGAVDRPLSSRRAREKARLRSARS